MSQLVRAVAQKWRAPQLPSASRVSRASYQVATPVLSALVPSTRVSAFAASNHSAARPRTFDGTGTSPGAPPTRFSAPSRTATTADAEVARFETASVQAPAPLFSTLPASAANQTSSVCTASPATDRSTVSPSSTTMSAPHSPAAHAARTKNVFMLRSSLSALVDFALRPAAAKGIHILLYAHIVPHATGSCQARQGDAEEVKRCPPQSFPRIMP